MILAGVCYLYSNKMNGWIKLHRKLIDWEWYDDPNTLRLFLHILLKANHKTKKYRGVTIKPGQIMTGQDLLASELGLTRRNIRTSLTKLKSTNELTIKSSAQGTIIQIVNYVDYQMVTSKTTSDRPTSDQRPTTNKKDKKEEKIYRAFAHLSITQDQVDKIHEEEWQLKDIDNCLDQIENYAKNTAYVNLNLTVRNWLKRGDYKKKPKTVPHWNLEE